MVERTKLEMMEVWSSPASKMSFAKPELIRTVLASGRDVFFSLQR